MRTKAFRPPLLSSLSVLLCLAACATRVHAGDFLLVGQGVQPAPIWRNANPSPDEKRAAAALESYLTRLGGVKFAVSDLPATGEPTGDRAILLAKRPGKKIEFGWRVTDKRLELWGQGDHALTMAVYTLLEERLGCRWWSWNEEFVPAPKPETALAVPAGEATRRPAFASYHLYNKEAESGENDFRFKRRTIGGDEFSGGHNLCPLLKPYAEKKPEFLPTNDKGERAFNDLHMNYTAPGMPEALAEAMEKTIAARGIEGVIHFAGMGDWYGGMDMTPASKAIYEEEAWTDPDGRRKPGYTATLLRMINRTAELLEAKHPGVVIGTFAYMSLEAPPAKTRPRDNVAIRVPRLRHDTLRSVEESEGNASFKRNLERWLDLAPGRVHVWDYGANFTNFMRPFPCLRSIAENIRYYHRAGVAGVMVQGNYAAHGGDLAVLKNYVWSRLLWDPSLKTDDLVREFCEGYYGPAGPAMIDYVNNLEDAPRDRNNFPDGRLNVINEFDKSFTYLTPSVLAKADALLAEAVSKTTEGGDHRRRVLEAGASLEVYRLWRDGPLKEVGERLVRMDFPEDTYPRAVALVPLLREGTVTEFSNGVRLRKTFPSMHGGPMPILKAGEVTVKVAPHQNGQVRSVLLGGVVAVDEATVAFRPGGYTYELEKREGNVVTMEGELGISLWGRGASHAGRQRVELRVDGTLVVEPEIKALGGKDATEGATFITTFRVAGNADAVTVEHQDEAGQWQKVVVTKDAPEAKLPRASAVRVTRHDRQVVLHDSFTSPTAAPPTGTLKLDPKSGDLKLTIEMPTIEADTKSFKPCGRRELRVGKAGE